MKKYLLLFSFAISYLLSEPSAFDAGRLNSSTPYGLTESEKQIYNINAKVQSNTGDIVSLKSQVDKLSEQLEGSTSILDGLNYKIASILQTVQGSSEGSNVTVSGLQAELLELQAYVKESRAIETANQESVKQVLTELSAMVDKTNTSFVSLEKRVLALEGKKSAPTTATTSAATSSDDLFKEAEKLLEGKDYNGAKSILQDLVAKNYKPARSSFMIGETAYFSENWNEAILQYQKSVGLNSKADYMPKLLYHTAISFDKIKDVAQANQFYKLLKSDYPNSKEAKAAPNR